MVGLPAAGKTTVARRMQAERGGLRLTPDEWMKPLFGHNDADGKRDVLEGRFIAVAMEALRSGVDVILDFGVWSRAERSALRALAAGMGARCELVYLPVVLGEQLDRIRRRNEQHPATTFDISELDLTGYATLFEEPGADELHGTTLPEPPVGWTSWRAWAAHRWPTSMG